MIRDSLQNGGGLLLTYEFRRGFAALFLADSRWRISQPSLSTSSLIEKKSRNAITIKIVIVINST